MYIHKININTKNKMKNFLLLLLLVTGSTFAQDKAAEQPESKIITTEEEYNYLTQGYKIAIETGADMKVGYTLEHMPEIKAGNFTAKYSFLKETATKQTKAVLIVLEKEKGNSDKVVYLCLPFNNGELLKKFYAETQTLGITMMDIFSASFFKFASQAADKACNTIKTK
jgi:hypothetical protein